MSKNKFVETVELLQKLPPWEVPMAPEVQNHIITLYDSIYGEGGRVFCEREARYINRNIVDDKKKWNATPLSVFLAFVDLAVQDLSFEPGAQALCYLLNRSVKVPGGDGKDYYENRCYLALTGYGEILRRQRAGQIRHCDTPTVVYQGDEFSYVERDGCKHVSYGLNLSHNPAQPIACFMKITRLDNTVDYGIILPEAWGRLLEYSKKQNQGRANALYTSGAGDSIDPGFLIAKCVKHAFKGYPKLPIGKGTVMEADLPEKEVMPDFYNLGEAPAVEQKAEESFAPVLDTSTGITIGPSQSDSDDETF